MNFFRSCFEPIQNPNLGQLTVLRKQESPHKKLQTQHHNIPEFNKQSDEIANKLEIRGGWKHVNQDIDYRQIAYRQAKYRQFIRDRRRDMKKWGELFQDQQG